MFVVYVMCMLCMCLSVRVICMYVQYARYVCMHVCCVCVCVMYVCVYVCMYVCMYVMYGMRVVYASTVYVCQLRM